MISYNWLKDYVNIEGIDPEELSAILTNTGLEVEVLEKFQSVKGGLEGIVIGKVLTCEKHPNADKLSITKVDIGTGKPLPIVCGAPNVEAGQKVLVATAGTTLTMNDESFTIARTRIRGVESEGMICAEDEVGLGTSHEGIMVLEEDARVGIPAKEHFEIEEDWVFEIGLTPNRTDATSHIGTARDIVAALNQQKGLNLTLNRPSVEGFKTGKNARNIIIEIEDSEACPRYTGLTMMGINVQESPQWLRNRLNAVGIRPINNIVDITNYVLMETGQPLHAFNADRIKGDRVIIRKARPSEPFVTLDEIRRELLETDLMICDEKDPLCIAGVFGGMDSGVDENTENIFLESAHFDPSSVRKTSRYHGLQTDASFRFERGADPNITVYAIKRAATLIQEICGGNIASDIVDEYPGPVEPWTVELSYRNLDTLVGKQIEPGTVKNILKNLEIIITDESKSGLTTTIPTYRYDVRREADLIEEILRIYGYNNVEFGEKLNTSLTFYPKPDRDKVQNTIADLLAAIGFDEIMNNSLTKSSYSDKVPGFLADHNVMIYNPLSSDLNVLRQTLLFGGLETVQYNQNRQARDLKMFEFGTAYQLNQSADKSGDPLNKYSESIHLSLVMTGRKEAESWNTSDANVDFFYLKAAVEQVAIRLGVDLEDVQSRDDIPLYFEYGLNYSKDGKSLITMGSISKKALDIFDIRQAVYYADLHWDNLLRLVRSDEKKYIPVSRYPEVRRDLALMVDKAVSFHDIKNLVEKTDKRLIQDINLFDVYEGDKIEEGKKSYAISVILKDRDKTLTDNVVDKIISKAISLLQKELGANIR